MHFTPYEQTLMQGHSSHHEQGKNLMYLSSKIINVLDIF